MNYEDLINSKPEFFFNSEVPLKLVLSSDEIKSWQDNQKEKLLSNNLPVNWSDIGIIYEDRYLVILRDLIEFPNGVRNGYSRLFNRATLENGAAGVVVLPIVNGKFLLLHQFRHATRSWHWEIPRGFGEPGISAREQAKTEIREEIDGEIKDIIELGLYHNNTGLEGNKIHLFLATINSVGEPAREEGIESYIFVSLAELEDMIAKEEITDGFTIAAYSRAKLKGLI
jgi:ADP-ribose pyrophosphatase